MALKKTKIFHGKINVSTELLMEKRRLYKKKRMEMKRSIEKLSRWKDQTYITDADFKIQNRIFAMLFKEQLTLQSSPEQVTNLVETYDFTERSSENHQRHRFVVDVLRADCDAAFLYDLTDESYSSYDSFSFLRRSQD